MSIHDQIIAHLMGRLFSGALIQNDYRGDYVEEMVALALAPDWKLCSEAWAGWDLEHSTGLRLLVKQSAARQSWEGNPYVGSFGIAPATGYWIDGTNWIDEPGGPADLYLFAWHPRADDGCDHRDPEQWRFFVVRERDLPAGQKTIRRTVLERSWRAVGYGELANEVAEICRQL